MRKQFLYFLLIFFPFLGIISFIAFFEKKPINKNNIIIPVFKENNFLPYEKHVLKPENYQMKLYLEGIIEDIVGDEIFLKINLPVSNYNIVKDLSKIEINAYNYFFDAQIEEISQIVVNNHFTIYAKCQKNNDIKALKGMKIVGKVNYEIKYNVFLVPKTFIYKNDYRYYAYKWDDFLNTYEKITIEILANLSHENKFIILGDFKEDDIIIKIKEKANEQN